ncbi:MAG: cadmium-translocating P-type ATPase [Nitrospirae bacterium]|nr:cadmium-translocating P-type ATPase [Nitrospirota bacterium]
MGKECCHNKECNSTSNGNKGESNVKKVNGGRKKYILEGLTCASCASKIQEALRKLPGISAELNFATGTLLLDTPDREAEQRVIDTILSIEPGVSIKEIQNDGDEDETVGNGSIILRKISYAGTFFIIGLMIDYYFLPESRGRNLTSADFWYVFLPYLSAYLIAGYDILGKALQGIRTKDFFSENLLMSIATLGAFAIGEFPEAVGVMLFFKVGEYFEDKAVNHSRRSIKNLLKIRANYANLLKDGKTLQVNPEDVSVGDIIVIKPGEKIPLDGVVQQGDTTVDTSALTGESMPRSLGPGDVVLSGMVNKNAVITVRVTKPFEESTVSKILELVEKAAAQKAPTEKFITKFSKVYTPVVVAAAFLIAVLPPLLYQIQGLTPLFSHAETYSEWIYRALVFLVIACPCALVLSIPVGFFGGIGAAAKKGVLFKGSNYLEAFRSIHTMVFDKTGTLTEGVFKVVDAIPFNSFTKDELLRLAALAESRSNHPIAKSISEAYGGSIDEGQIEHYEEIPAHGVKVLSRGKEILAGNDRILHMDGYDIEHDTCVTEGTVVHVAVDRKYAGYILLADKVRDDAIETIKSLRREGVKRIVMLTGDDREAAESVARQLQIDEYHAELLPQQKIEIVKRLEEEMDRKKDKIAFVGDGINDAPVLMASDIGIAMGGLGSDAAIEAADVVLMKDRLSALLDAVYVSRRTKGIVVGNISMAFAVKAFFLVFGAIGMATMWEAVFADVGVAILAVLNSTRILKK